MTQAVKENPRIAERWGVKDIRSICNEAQAARATRPGCCPDCGGPMQPGGGCPVCVSCGYSECS